jgi:hypothetical protein
LVPSAFGAHGVCSWRGAAAASGPTGGKGATMGRMVSTVAALVLVVAAGAWAPPARAQGTIPTDAQRRECERNGGYWVTASGSCKIGA